MNVPAEIGKKLLEEGIKEGASHLAHLSHHCAGETVKQAAASAAGLAATYAAGHVGTCAGCAGAVAAGKAGVGLGAAAWGLACAHPVIALGVLGFGLFCLWEAGEEIG